MCLPEWSGHVTDSDMMRLQAGHEFRSRWATPALDIELFEMQATHRQRVDVRHFNLTTVAANIRVPHTIDQDDRDIRKQLLCPYSFQ